MAYLIPIQYHKCRYPEDIKPTISEVAGHFDTTKVNVDGDYSLLLSTVSRKESLIQQSFEV